MFEVTQEWIEAFVRESNRIDPQPVDEVENHTSAVEYAVATGSSGRFSLPRTIHQLLLPEHPLAGRVRKEEAQIGLNPVLPAGCVPRFFWEWNRKVFRVIKKMRRKRSDRGMIQAVWDLHAELLNIRPYELYNGKMGRILMINHALLLGVEPRLIRFEQREDYFDLIRHHETAKWGFEPPVL